MSQEDVLAKSRMMCDIFTSSDMYKYAKIIMLYMPLGNESDTSNIIRTAYADGKKVVFPMTDSDSGVITPVYADEDAVFTKGAFSVMEPEKSTVADVSDIEAVIVPGIAYDVEGHRIGFGKGCYDRLLNNFSGVKIGFCYSSQLCESIPTDEHDICMDYLITEKGLIECLTQE